jgi:predicted transcriptional regulator
MSKTRETLAQAAARRLRGQLGEQCMSKSEFAELLGWSRAFVQRRIQGEVALNLDELELIQRRTGIRITFLLGLEL